MVPGNRSRGPESGTKRISDQDLNALGLSPRGHCLQRRINGHIEFSVVYLLRCAAIGLAVLLPAYKGLKTLQIVASPSSN
jgi:hypothetical protein